MARAKTLFFYLVLVACALASVFPFAFALFTSFKAPSEAFSFGAWPAALTFENYHEVLRTTPLFLRWVLNSLAVAVVTVALLLLLSLMGGFSLARIAFPGRKTLFLILLASMMIPNQVLWIPNYTTLSRLGWVNTYWGLVPGLVATLSTGTFLVAQFLRALPIEIEEAATLDGLSRYGMFWRLIVPLTGPVAATVTITSFMASWNAFAWPLIVLNSPELFTLPVGLNFFKGLYVTRWTLIMAGSMFNTLPVLVVFALFQRHFIKGVATTGLKE
ncbi:carbohydrate ABC transporter permease [bacterium]|nr:carbohydrate ABC transporter permease [bacterium]